MPKWPFCPHRSKGSGSALPVLLCIELMPEVVGKTKLKPGKKHVPQKHGGPKRPSSHSGKRLTKQQLIEKARQEVKQEIDQLQERLTNALKDHLLPEEKGTGR